MFNWVKRLFGKGERKVTHTQLKEAIGFRAQTERFQAVADYRKPAITTNTIEKEVREEDNTMSTLLQAAILADVLSSSNNSDSYGSFDTSSNIDTGTFDGGGGSSGGAGSEGSWDSGSSDSGGFDSGGSDGGGSFDSSSF